MRVGLDFDNTIVSYDALFHKLAREGGWIPEDLPCSKLLVRDHLRQIGNEDVWTEMQGLVYGARMAEAESFPGVAQFMRWAQGEGLEIFIVSHKTRYPFLGPQYDLHAAARGWIENSLRDERGALIGVNRGRLGFLADIGVDQMLEDIGHILDGEYHSESRLLLSSEIMRMGKIVHSATALNDVIVTKGELARMIEFETYLDGEFVHSIRGDGIIVASPTGSTAYALSAGGPILHPALEAIAVVPICPHTLSNRPIVFSSDSIVEILVTRLTDQHAYASFDGQSTFTLEDNDRVYVRRAETVVELLHPSGRSHFEVMRIKLHWGRNI